MSAESPLSRLIRVDLRQIWTNESSGFTPWLAESENLALLGETIGIELELEAQEKDVGPFRADILCKDTATDNWVLIENQLERTDHGHLGQLLTYAAGLKAVTIVWIAQRFTEEHRATLDWLNEITDERFSFFGLEVELWRIADSPVAPKFSIVSQPNDWSKDVARGANQVQSGGNGAAKQIQLEFWTAFRDYAREHSKIVKPTKPHAQHWMDMAIGRSGIHLSAIASFYDSAVQSYDSQELRATLSLVDANAKAYFSLLEAKKDELERQMGEPLVWYNPATARSCRIYVRESVDLNDRNRWPEYVAWLTRKLEALHRVFGPLVKTLDARAVNFNVEREAPAAEAQ